MILYEVIILFQNLKNSLLDRSRDDLFEEKPREKSKNRVYKQVRLDMEMMHADTMFLFKDLPESNINTFYFIADYIKEKMSGKIITKIVWDPRNKGTPKNMLLIEYLDEEEPTEAQKRLETIYKV